MKPMGICDRCGKMSTRKVYWELLCPECGKEFEREEEAHKHKETAFQKTLDTLKQIESQPPH
jgi:uncharacterized Zn finger protein (UPF0148 family)